MIPRNYRQLLILLSLLAAVIYLGYRGIYTLNLESPYAIFASLLLYIAELWGVVLMALFFFQVWETTSPEPAKPLEGKSVDVMIPTYNEDVHLLRGTVEAAKAIRYPHTTYLLDDGNRTEVKELAEELGVEYITRENNMHAKAGNLNNALDQTNGEFVIIFDADHVASPNFIDRLIGYFADEKLAFVQTPHAFYNFENFQSMLDYQRDAYWEEGQIFYNVIQAGKNYWNSVVFCGSAAMFRRTALEEVGLIATETITEDMHTGLRLHALGWKGLFVNERLIAAQAAPDVTTFHSQRARWGEGNLSIMAYDNPLTMKGLTLAQRLNYLGSMLSWTTGLTKVGLYLTPALMLFTGIAPVKKLTWELGLITLAYLLITWTAVKVACHGYGNLWHISQSAMANFWNQVRSTYRAMIGRKRQKFVVTSKRGSQSNSLIGQIIPHFLLIMVGMSALVWGLLRYRYGISHDPVGLVIGGTLVFTQMVLAWHIVRRALKDKDGRFSYRFPVNSIHLEYNYLDRDPDTQSPPVVAVSSNDSDVAAYDDIPISTLINISDTQVLRDLSLGSGQAVSVDINERGLGMIAYERLPVGKVLSLRIQAGGWDFKVLGEIRNSKPVIDSVSNRLGKVTAYRYGIQFVNLTSEQTRLLWEVMIQYAVQKQYQRFDVARLDFWGKVLAALERMLLLPGNRQKAQRMPLRLRAAGDASENFEIGGVTEHLFPQSFQVLLNEYFSVGQLLELELASPFGPITATGRVNQVEKQYLGEQVQYVYQIQFAQFWEESRNRYASLVGAVPTRHMKPVVCLTPRATESPQIRPVAMVMVPSFLMVFLALGSFHHVYSNGILLNQIATGHQPSRTQREQLSKLVNQTLETPEPTMEEVTQIRNALLKLDQYEQAAELAGKILSKFPSDFEAQMAWAHHLQRTGQQAEAESYMSNLLRRLDESSLSNLEKTQLLLNAARSSVNLGKLQEGVERFERLLKFKPVDPEILNEYAGVLFALERWEDAEQVLRDIPKNPQTQRLLISLLTKQQRWDEAQAECTAFLEQHPYDPHARRLLADVSSWNGDYSVAIQLYQRLTEENPEDQALQLRLAEVLLWAEEFDRAIVAFTPLLDENLLEASYLSDFVGASVGASVLTPKAQTALAQIAQGVEEGRITEEKLIAQLSESLIRHHKPESAIGLLEKLVERDPENRRLRLRLADVLHDLKQYQRADKHYQHLLASAGKVSENSTSPRLSQRTESSRSR